MIDEVMETRPPPPPWLDRSFIQTALRAEDGDSSINVLSCDVHFANALGDGYSSDIYRAYVQLQDSTYRSVIIKCHPQGDKREEIVRDWQAFQRETHMLTKTLPAMHNILERACPGKFQAFAAKCLYAGDYPIPFLVLDDLKQSGFTLAKRQQGVDLAHCSLAMKSLAHFHASSLALYDEDPTAITYYGESLYSEKLRHHLTPYNDTAIMLLGDEVSKWPGYEKYADKLRMIRESYLDRLIQVCKRREGGYNCLIHGDLWTSNLMFKYSDEGVTDLRLVDFQNVHYSSPGLDLQYFLHICPSQKIREQYIDNLIQVYHNTLVETLNILGCTEHEISLEQLRKEFDERAFFGFYASTTVLPIALSDPSDGFNLEETLKNEGEGTKRNKIYSREYYMNSVKRLLPIFENNKIF